VSGVAEVAGRIGRSDADEKALAGFTLNAGVPERIVAGVPERIGIAPRAAGCADVEAAAVVLGDLITFVLSAEA
jgi:hypothetical protein